MKPDNTSAQSSIIPALPIPYTTDDAFSRITQARIGSLAPDQITPEYLLTLTAEISKWQQIVNEEITRRGMSLYKCDNCGREFAHQNSDLMTYCAECLLEQFNEKEDTAAADQRDEREGEK